MVWNHQRTDFSLLKRNLLDNDVSLGLGTPGVGWASGWRVFQGRTCPALCAGCPDVLTQLVSLSCTVIGALLCTCDKNKNPRHPERRPKA